MAEIKKANRGKFTKYCKRQGFKGVTKSCIAKAKKSKSKNLRKEAIFAENMKYKRETY